MLFFEKIIYFIIKYNIKGGLSMKKNPDIFKPGINKQLNNNNKVYYSFIDDIKDSSRNILQTSKKNVKKDILTNGYDKQIVIVTKDGEHITKILDKMGTNIITSDGKIIAISNIIAIYKA